MSIRHTCGLFLCFMMKVRIREVSGMLRETFNHIRNIINVISQILWIKGTLSSTSKKINTSILFSAGLPTAANCGAAPLSLSADGKLTWTTIVWERLWGEEAARGKGLKEILPKETRAHNGLGIRPQHTPTRVMGDLKNKAYQSAIDKLTQ